LRHQDKGKAGYLDKINAFGSDGEEDHFPQIAYPQHQGYYSNHKRLYNVNNDQSMIEQDKGRQQIRSPEQAAKKN